jgi:hypothetical protein
MQNILEIVGQVNLGNIENTEELRNTEFSITFNQLAILLETTVIDCCKIADRHLDSEWPAGEIAHHFDINYNGEEFS